MNKLAMNNEQLNINAYCLPQSKAAKIHEKPYLCDRNNLFKKHTKCP